MSILITGGAGFIGSRLALGLTKRGYEVTVIDNLSEQVHGTIPHKSPLFRLIDGKVNFVRGDVRLIDDIREAVRNSDYIFHLVAETGTGQSMYKIATYSEVNIQGTANLLECICESSMRIRKVILASSRAIYGEGLYKCEKCGHVTPRSRREEDMRRGEWSMFCPLCNMKVSPVPTPENTPADPQSIYAVTKHTQELLVKRACSAYGIPFVILRYQNVYGPGQSMKNPYTGVLGAFATQIQGGKNPEIFEDGTEARDFIHIADVTRANVKAVIYDDCNNQVINIGFGKPVAIKRAAELLVTKLGADMVPQVNGKFRVGDIYNCFADITLAAKVLNFRPQISFEAGIQEFADWARQQTRDPSILTRSFEEMASRGLYK